MDSKSSAAKRQTRERKAWMETLAKAPAGELSAFWAEYQSKPDYTVLRGPEMGLVMVQGRVGGSGSRFNLGEMTLTRCSVSLASGLVGHAYVAGRRPRRAELAAVFDALLQDPNQEPALQRDLIEPIEKDLKQERLADSCRAASSKVDFFTMVRGDD